MVAKNTLATIMLLTPGIPGLYLNLLSTLPLLDATTPFEMICACHAAGNAGVIALMVFCSAPMIYFESPSLNDSEFGKMAGRIIMYSWFLIHYTEIILSINRFMAINCFIAYKSVFSIKNTKRILIVLCVYLLWYFFIGFFEGCHFVFSQQTWAWGFEPTHCGVILGIYLDFYFTVAILLCCTAFDICTAMSIYRHFKITRADERSFSTTDVLFFVQSCLSNLVFILDLTLFFTGPTIYHSIFGEVPDAFGTFLIITFTMEISHVMDGLIIVLFNRKTRTHILSPRKLARLRFEGSHAQSLTRVGDISRARVERQKQESSTKEVEDVHTEQ